MSSSQSDTSRPLAGEIESNQQKSESFLDKLKNIPRKNIIIGISIALVVVILLIVIIVVATKSSSSSSSKFEGLDYEYDIDVTPTGEDYHECHYARIGQEVQIFGDNFNPSKYQGLLEVEVDGRKIPEIEFSYKFTEIGRHKVKITFKEEKLAEEEMIKLFTGIMQVQKLHFNKVNTEHMTNFAKMFSNMGCLEEINLENFNTAKVTDMTALFRSSFNIKKLDLSSFDTSQVTSMQEMFNQLHFIESVKFDKNKFKTDNVQSMIMMFYCCGALTSLDISSFNIDKIASFDLIFSGANNLELTLTKSQYDKIKQTSRELDTDVKKLNIIE